MSAMLRVNASSSVASRPGRAPLTCKAISATPPDRRSLLASLIAAPAASVLFASPAFALIPDDDDEELVEKAKANRKARLEQDRLAVRKFMADEGLTNKELEKELALVQKGVFELAKTGSQVQSGDVKGAASTLSEPWVKAFTIGAGKFGYSDALVASVSELQETAVKGDAKAAKKAYVGVVDAVQAWANAASLSDKLRGL